MVPPMASVASRQKARPRPVLTAEKFFSTVAMEAKAWKSFFCSSGGMTRPGLTTTTSTPSGRHWTFIWGVVDRIITDLCVLDVTPHGLKLVELAPGVTRDEVQGKTGVPLQ